MWNRIFTGLIRQSDSKQWGNWSLDPRIKVGSIGSLSTDGAFAPVGSLTGYETETTRPSVAWQKSTKRVRRKTFEIQPEAGVTQIPVGTTGITLDASGGFVVSWEFEAASELMSEFNVSRIEFIRDAAQVAASNKASLNALADSIGLRTAGSIDQGFGFISSVVWAKSGINAASRTQNSKLSISGKADAAGKLLGTTGLQAALSGSYAVVHEEGDIDKQIWPAPGTADGEEIPVAYTFASFEGDILIPDWTGYIQNIVAEFRNAGSYVAKVEVSYKDSSGHVNETYAGISGGTSRQIIMPLDASDVAFDVTFVGYGNHVKLVVPSPLRQAHNGRLEYQIAGLWPSGPEVIPIGIQIADLTP
ncbi:MAG TPA: hypothetical protein VH877_24850 [Polyangia bacterium]|nr:hypothetical protein [Polyangia bacterium]